MDLFDDCLYYCHSCYCRIIFCLLLRLDWNAWIIPSHAIHRLSDRVFFLIFNLCNPMVQVSNAKILWFLKMYGPRFFHISLHFWSTINIAMCFLVFCKRCVFGWLLWYPYFFFLRMPNDERNDKNFQKRFGYFVASGTLDLITMWVYIFFLNAFLDIEKKYQPILGWVRYYWSWIISFICTHLFQEYAPGTQV